MRSKRVWILLAIAVVVIVALFIWKPWREAAPTPSPQAGPVASQTPSPANRYEPERAQAEAGAQQALDAEAVAVLAKTDEAQSRIAAKDKAGAIRTLEEAAGKADILVGRNPAAALIPAATEVQIIDVAPADLGQVRKLRRAVELAVLTDDFPKARVALDGMRSEIRVRTYYLPLATYPAALASAAGLVERGDLTGAAEALDRARSTLAMTDVAIPLPLLAAETAVEAAKADTDAQKKLGHVEAARAALERTEALGYASRDVRKALLAEIREVERQAKGGSDIKAGLEQLQERISKAIGDLKAERKSAEA
ncbi:chromosome segregation ATPase (plasmid) [Phenylobacterium zucineum HLK1]|uniref:Chromosome segregation ATPase n=1 Tax=Phenylobacterium zucineum (strain HLK1) TaxID=450851 RepID=B4RI26_PHEZH|nr:YfdX family protein [Phenylobacterium zucineum]ACG80001.1 chromosome segregation ATPase [Phenylobacterium zucineum HLK1]